MSKDDSLFRGTLSRALTSWNVAFDKSQMKRMEAHFHAVVEANRVMNLTRITDPEEAAVKHYADSLAILPWIDQQRREVSRVLDLGTGAGFPAVPLAIMRPNWDVVALDGTAKKIAFLRRVTAELSLDHLECIHAHSTHYHSAEGFDLVLTRAVGSLARCVTASVVHVRPGGWMVAYKTAAVGDELDEVASLLHRHRLDALEPHPYELNLRGQVLSRLLVPFRRRG